MHAIEFRHGSVVFLDQTKLPTEEIYVEVSDYRDLVVAIKNLSIRGAPLIGIVAAYGVVLAALAAARNTPTDFLIDIRRSIDVLLASRPTAVNLAWTLNRQRSVLERYSDLNEDKITAHLAAEAMLIHREDEEMCERISEYGANLLPNAASVLTLCNTGALATGGRGTALGAISRAWETMKLKKVYVDETRPLLQGARLTAWELKQAGIQFELIADNTAAFLMQQGLVNCVIVGADRIAANGDTANKIGTYNLAVLAKFHRLPFWVAAPTSTIDLLTEHGRDILIEQRKAEELTELNGVRLAPTQIAAYTPAFDVTPHELISAIITECGVCHPPYAQSLSSVVHREIAA